MTSPTVTTLPALELGLRTDPGRDPTKQVNEDACDHRETPLGHLVIVCDGMGGHEGGREASHAALATIIEVVQSAPPASTAPTVLKEAVVQANARVHAMSSNDHSRPGSTVVALLLHRDGAEVAHVGDSRCYLIQKGAISQVTKDHSLVQQLVDAGVLTREQAEKHPEANKITRALGMSHDVDVELRPQALTFFAGDIFVLCSDGLSDLVKPQEILQIAGTAPPAQAAGQLVDLANARGGHDNISVVVVRARESSIVVPASILPTVTQTMPQPAIATVMSAEAPPATHRVPVSGIAPVLAPTRRRATTTESEETSSARRGTIALVVGLVLGLTGLALAAFAIYVLEGQRHRRTHAPSFVDGDAAAAPVPFATASGPAVIVAVDADVAPTVATDAAPLLELLPPSGATGGRHHRAHNRDE